MRTHTQLNTFQGIVITDGSISFTVFTYMCGEMNWSGGATIGFIADSSFYANHPLSGTANANDVACVNSPATVWSNVFYDLISQPVISTTVLPTLTPTPTPVPGMYFS